MLFSKVYHDHQDASWVVFVHGAGGNSSIWFKQLKAFRKHFNVLLVDLRGHGRSHMQDDKKAYSFDLTTQDLIDLLDARGIASAYFVGVSLGSLMVHNLAILAPCRIKAMVFAGAVLGFRWHSKVLIALGHMTKHIVPYMWLYRLFAYTVMPQKGQKQARDWFVHTAKKMCQKEFKKWFALTHDSKALFAKIAQMPSQVPTLYIMGESDFMFLKFIAQRLQTHPLERLCVISKSGHVCNIQDPDTFNSNALDFLMELERG